MPGTVNSGSSPEFQSNISGGVSNQPPEATSADVPASGFEDRNSPPKLPAAPGSDKQTNSYIPRDLSEVEAMLARISEALRGSKPTTGSGTGAQPKQ